MKVLDDKGLTLIELLAVVVILGIIAAVSFPLYFTHAENARAAICDENSQRLEQFYETDLLITGAQSDVKFRQYLLENPDYECPDEGEYSYVDDEVLCDHHDEVEDDGGDVPFL